MKKRYLHKLTVKGLGSFPIDMLRYDRCMPYSEEDASKINQTFWPSCRDQIEITVYKISDLKDPQWEIRRWESFCYKMVKEDSRPMI